MLVVAATLYLYFRVTREGDKFHTVTGKGYRPTVIQLGGWRYVTAALLLLYSFVLLVLPFLIVLWASLLPFYMQPSLEAFSLFTLKNFITAIHFPKITDSIKNSVLLGLGSATVVMLLTTFASWILVRTKLRGRWLLDLLTTLPLLFPVSSWAWRSCGFICSCRFRFTARCGFCWWLYYALHPLRYSLHPFRPAATPS